MALRMFLVGVALFMCHVAIVNACSCVQTDKHAQFCSADYAVRGRILKEERIYEKGYNAQNDPYGNMAKNRYTVRVLKVFKGQSYFKANAKRVFIYTAVSSAMCGVDFPVPPRGRERFRNVWLITGSEYNGELSTGSCNWSEPYKPLSRFLKRSLRTGKYELYCKIQHY